MKIPKARSDRARQGPIRDEAFLGIILDSLVMKLILTVNDYKVNFFLPVSFRKLSASARVAFSVSWARNRSVASTLSWTERMEQANTDSNMLDNSKARRASWTLAVLCLILFAISHKAPDRLFIEKLLSSLIHNFSDENFFPWI